MISIRHHVMEGCYCLHFHDYWIENGA